MSIKEIKNYWVYSALVIFAMSLLASVAGINIATFMLLIASPWFWKEYQQDPDEKYNTILIWGLIFALCLWDAITNLFAGVTIMKSLWAMQHDLRVLIFIICLWPIFAQPNLARFALACVILALVCIASINLIATWTGQISAGQYLWRTMHHLHGQMSVGAVFLLLQLILSTPKYRLHFGGAVLLLLTGMLMANERRAGYFLFLAGFPLWIYLNREKLSVDRFKWWIMSGVVLVLVVALSSPVVHTRIEQVWQDVAQFMSMTSEQRAQVTTSVGIRLQFYASVWTLIQQNNWMTGIGSVNFASQFADVNYSMGTTPELAKAYFASFQNPHNEYLFMLATKGVIGLLLYVSIFIHACNFAWKKSDDVQRNGLIIFVFLFMLSITTNSMMTDMEEGHFTMMIMLIFLAPKSLNLVRAACDKEEKS